MLWAAGRATAWRESAESMAAYQQLREFLADLERDCPEQVVRVEEPVDPRFEATAVVMEAERLPNCPVVCFERVGDSRFPVVVNVLSTRERLARGLGIAPDALGAVFGERVNHLIEPRHHADAPFEANVLEGEALDLGVLPALTHFEQDGGPYITGGHVVARDPLTGIETIGYHRVMVKGPRRLGISLHSRRRMFEYHRRAAEAGRPLEVAVVLGVPPAVSLGSIAIPPAEAGKFAIIGGLLDQPLEVARCRTVDLEVPRWAEIIVEGHVLAEEREREGPFGEFTGYASTRGTENVLVPTAIQFRDGAIYQSHNAGLSLEHCMFLAFPREVLVAQVLRRIIPNLVDVRVPIRSGCGSFHVYVSMRKTAEGQPKQAMMAVLGADHYFKHVIVVDEDIDVQDDEQVLWAVATRMQADRDLVIVDGGMGTLLDPSSPDGTSAKLGIDATRPLAGFAEALTIPGRAVARARRLLDLPG